MTLLNKWKLDFEASLKYLQENLDSVNALSSELIKLLNFKNGSFFTLLPDDAKVQAIHNFTSGWILPQNPVEEFLINDYKATYSIKKSIEEYLIPILKEIIESKNYYSCIIDDFEGYPKNRYNLHYADNYSLFNGDEVYFRLNKNNLTTELLKKCLRSSNKLWHSLCVFTMADLTEVTKNIDLDKIKEICLKTELVMVCAYDGEGYVFWEKNSIDNRPFLSNDMISTHYKHE